MDKVLAIALLLVTEPPAEYRGIYNGPLKEYLVPLDEARRLCAKAGLAFGTDACQWWQGQTCVIVIPKNGPAQNIMAYRRHELAHCLGWSHK